MRRSFRGPARSSLHLVGPYEYLFVSITIMIGLTVNIEYFKVVGGQQKVCNCGCTNLVEVQVCVGKEV